MKKTGFSNEEIARKFANGDTCGESGHMFIDGDTVYSYGYHFPIAKRLLISDAFGDRYLFNSNGYSSTTAQHKARVLRALGNATIIYIKGCDIEKKNEQIKANDEEILRLSKIKSRTEWRKQYNVDEITRLQEQNRLLEVL